MRRVLVLVLLACNLAACGGERAAGPGLTVPANELGPAAESLPPEGVAVEVSRRLAGDLLLIGLDGRVLARPKLRIDAESQLYRSVLVLRGPRSANRFVVGPLGGLVRYRRAAGYPRLLEWSHDGRCGTFARHGGDVYRLCGKEPREPTAIEAVRAGSHRVVAGRPPRPRPLSDHFGFWRDAYLSPDGKTVLATWSVECEIPTAFFAGAAGGVCDRSRARRTGGGRRSRLGWAGRGAGSRSSS
jgi:hypothetical protein